MSYDENKSGKLRLTLLLVLMACFFVGILIYAFKGMNSTKKVYGSNSTTHTKDTKVLKDELDVPKSLGVVKAINTTDKTILFFDITKNIDVELTYNGASDITDKYSRVIAIAQLTQGDMVDIFYKDSDLFLKKLQLSNDAWEYRGVKNLRIDRTNNIMKISSRKYGYTSKLYVRNLSNEINLLNINDEDELTVRGYKSTIYSITVTKGHGSIRLEDYGDFVGGTLHVGASEFAPITEDMVVTVREGRYDIIIEKDGLTGTKNVNVLRDQEFVVNMGEFKLPVKEIGYVTFNISPFGATLTIDDVITPYDKDVSLEYGEHKIEVSLCGYETYKGTYVLDQSSDMIQIGLSKIKDSATDQNQEIGQEDTKSDTSNNNLATDSDGKKEEEDNSNNTATGNNYNPTKDDSNDKETAGKESVETEEKNEETSIDKNHFIHIRKPAGTSVYLDGVYKGIAPVKIEKPLGIHYITFLKEGYVQKTHTVNIADDSEDKYFTFPNLELAEED